MKIERAIIRRRVDNPAIAEGDRTQVDVDLEQVRAALAEGTRALQALDRLLNGKRRRARRRR